MIFGKFQIVSSTFSHGFITNNGSLQIRQYLRVFVSGAAITACKYAVVASGLAMLTNVSDARL